ncbi:hypothetical protein E1180_11445 [Roseibium denhamense]|nr:hypothetical protein [Roseibium denhamense]
MRRPKPPSTSPSRLPRQTAPLLPRPSPLRSPTWMKPMSRLFPTAIHPPTPSLKTSAGTQVGVTALATDSDITDSVSYAVDDARFTVDENGVVTVADGAYFDAETEGSIEITVTATSTDGSTSTETFTIAVSDVDEADVSAVSDSDTSANTIAEDAATGTQVGVTALATDSDVTDSVSYAVDDSRFTVDENGVVTVADGVSFDYESEPSISLTITATSTDGSTATETFTLDVADVAEHIQLAEGGVTFVDSGVAEHSITGGSGNDHITAHQDGGVLDGGDGTDTLVGGAGDDILDGGAGVDNDTLIGGEGSDTYLLRGDGRADAISDTGSTGSDTIVLSSGTGTEFELENTFNAQTQGIEVIDGSNVSGETLRAQTANSELDWDFTGITLNGVDQLEGRDGNDSITGSSGNDTIIGGAGNDTLSGAEGIDTLRGGEGDDVLYAGSGGETTSGATGTVGSTYNLIHLTTTADIDTDESNGSSENASTLLGSYGGSNAPLHKEIVSATANDADGSNVLADNDFNGTAETFTIGSGTYALDSLQVYDATVTFTDGTTGTFSAVVIQLENGEVYLAPEYASNADAVLLTSKPIQGISLDSVSIDNASMYANRLDTDYLTTTGDTLEGGSGNDTLHGGSDDDTLEGGANNDWIDGAAGTDTAIYSGNYADYDITENDDGSFTITDLRDGSPDGIDTVLNVENFRFADGDVASTNLVEGGVTSVTDTNAAANTINETDGAGTQVGVTAFADDPNGDAVTYTLSDDRFEIDADGVVTIADHAFFDSQVESEIGVTVTATSADGSTADETFSISVTGNYDSQFTGGTDSGTFSGTDQSYYVDGVGGSDNISTGDYNDRIEGGSQDDGSDNISGGGGRDLLFGEGGADNISGGAGDDVIIGGTGNDNLTGGDGRTCSCTAWGMAATTSLAVPAWPGPMSLILAVAQG